MARSKCESIVKKLLNAVISHQDQGRLSDYVNSEPKLIYPRWDTFLFADHEAQLKQKYWEAMVSLSRELVPAHISQVDLFANLWTIVGEIVSNRDLYAGDRQRLDNLVKEFIDRVKKPLEDFYVIYEIKNFDVGVKQFNVGNSQVFKLPRDFWSSLGFVEKDLPACADLFEEWTGKSVIEFQVKASDCDKVYETGLRKARNVIDVLKVIAFKGGHGELVDEMFLWELGQYLAIRVSPLEGDVRCCESFGVGRHPLVIPLGERIERELGIDDFWGPILSDSLPKDINRRITKAMEWMSHAVSADSLDYRSVDLCTALEILLLPNHTSGTKGELIAIRQRLLSAGGSYDPVGILHLYEKRSDIIHTGALGITSYSEYWDLMTCCLLVVRNIVHLSQKNPDIQDLETLLSCIERKENIQSFLSSCEDGTFRKGKRLKSIKGKAEEM